MANTWFNHAAHLIGQGGINIESEATAGDIRVKLLMTNFNFTAEKDAVNLGAMTLDECNGANYAEQALAGTAWTKDATNNRSELTANPTVFGSLGAGTRQNEGALVYWFDTNEASSIPLCYHTDGGFPFDGTGSDNTITWNAEGVLQIQTPAP